MKKALFLLILIAFVVAFLASMYQDNPRSTPVALAFLKPQPALKSTMQGSGSLLAKGPPTIARAQVNTLLCQAQSPACGTGDDLYDFATLNGVDPAFELAIFWHESHDGTSGVARSTHSLGNIRCAGFRTCIQGYRAYGSWVTGYEDFNRLMRFEYFPRGLVTVARIIPVYAPSGDHNDVAAYIADVQRLMQRWKQEA